MIWKTVRWILAGGVLLASVWLMVAALVSGIMAGIPLIAGVIFLVFFVVLIAPDTLGWFAKPFTDLLYPSEEFEKPLLSYNLARRYSQERRVDAAVQEYEKILRYYPEEQDAYVELIELAQRVGDDGLRASMRGC